MNASAEAFNPPVAPEAQWKTSGPRTDRASSGGGGAVYGIGMIGALAYFFQAAETGRDKALALPKALAWPALLVYKFLKQSNG